MKSKRIKLNVFTALMIAMSVVLGRCFLIPIFWTRGNINLCDAGIMLASLILGPFYGALVGGIGGMLLDLISGYAQFAIFSLMAHGLEGLVIGFIYFKLKNRTWSKYLALFLGSVVMIAGYVVADSYLYSLKAGWLGIGTNILQALIGAIVSLSLYFALSKKIHNIFEIN